MLHKMINFFSRCFKKAYCIWCNFQIILFQKQQELNILFGVLRISFWSLELNDMNAFGIDPVLGRRITWGINRTNDPGMFCHMHSCWFWFCCPHLRNNTLPVKLAFTQTDSKKKVMRLFKCRGTWMRKPTDAGYYL